MTTTLTITLFFVAAVLLVIAFTPMSKDDDNDYNGKDSQP